jgi:hypothetical protein
MLLRDTAIPASTRSRPSGPLRTVTLPPDPMSTLSPPRTGVTLTEAVAASALIFSTGPSSWPKVVVRFIALEMPMHAVSESSRPPTRWNVFDFISDLSGWKTTCLDDKQPRHFRIGDHQLAFGTVCRIGRTMSDAYRAINDDFLLVPRLSVGFEPFGAPDRLVTRSRRAAGSAATHKAAIHTCGASS